jgi:hypothetical protein
VFTVAWMVAGATRANYDPLRHPISSLSLGELGWVQVANFLVTGLLVLAFAIGLQRRPSSSGGSKWGPRLIGVIAIGLLGAGIFATDPMNGYPPGTPVLPLAYSVPGRLHRAFSAFVFLGMPIACFVFARSFARQGMRIWMTYSALTGIAFAIVFVLTSAAFLQVESLVNLAGLFQRVTLTIGWTWLTLLAVYVLKAPADGKFPSRPK